MNRIKLLREEFNFTQQDLADRLDSAKSTIAMYENGTRKPSYEVLLRLSEIFNCSVDYIMGVSNERKTTSIDSTLLKIGLDMKNYTPPTEEQKKQIEDFAKFVLKDNKKEN